MALRSDSSVHATSGIENRKVKEIFQNEKRKKIHEANSKIHSDVLQKKQILTKRETLLILDKIP
jgi:hypothetical protein